MLTKAQCDLKEISELLAKEKSAFDAVLSATQSTIETEFVHNVNQLNIYGRHAIGLLIFY